MIGFKVFRSIPTTLDLNGPTLSFLQEPVGIVTVESSASFTGIVTATPVGTGHLSYQWYEIDVGAIGSGSTANVGIATTLTLTGLVDPDDTGRQFYLETKYVASAYGVGRSTGNALNAPLISDTVGLGVKPTISITSQPGISTVVVDANATFNITATVTDGSDNLLAYQWQQDGTNLTDSSTVTGSGTTSLTISSSAIGVSTVKCAVSHPNASNSPLLSDGAELNVVSATARKILYVEEFDVNATLHSTQEVDLVDEALEIIPDEVGLAVTSNWNRIYSIYAPESDLSVKITLEGAAGKTPTTSSPRTPGEGGVSTFNLTLEQGQEYVVNLGAAIWPSGGNSSADTNEGGGGSFFYKGGELLVASGGGSGAGGFDNGVSGTGGGIGVNPSLTPIGLFAGGESFVNATGSTGGRVGGCTIGDFWQTQGVAPCASIGSTTFFTGKDGQKTSNMNGVTVIRGYKAGLNYQFNAGNSTIATNGGGGGGAIGGDVARGGTGFDGLGTATGTLGGNTRKVGVIKIEAV